MAKKNSNAPKRPMIFNSVLMINTENVVSLVNSLPKSRMQEEEFNAYMEKNFYFGNKFHGYDFNSGSHYSTVVRQLGLYHILGNEYIPRFYSNIDEQIAESFLRYWLKLYVAPNPTSQPILKKSVLRPKYVLKELIQFIESSPSTTNIYDIVDSIFGLQLSRNDKGNLPNIINKYSDCITIDENENVSLKSNYRQVMDDINELINNPNRYFDHFGKGDISFTNKCNSCLQQIFYGAPGTGKSHSIKEKTKDEEVIRTTFHPDSDYSTFVGAYKPTMVEEDAKVVPVVINNGISLDQNKGTYKEKRISYQFVKQAFLKAYLGAWKKYSMGLSSSPVSGITVSSGNEIWSLERIVDDKVFYLKSSILELEKYGDLVQKCWASIQESDDPDNYMPGTTERYQASACVWYKEKNSLEHTPEECWDAVKNELTNGGTILSTPGKYQSYSISLNGKDQIKISSRATAWKTTIYKNFHAPEEHGNSVQKAIARKLADYGEGDFDKLWNRLKEEVNQRQNSARNSSMNSVKPQFLIIEEINRGNCAQIFGDLFQLLDRSDNGFSTYPIDADTDIMNEINKAFKEEVEYKLDYDLNIEGVIEDYTSNYGASLSEDVQTGRVLLLPPNLYIWATMNTSDQSLFPIDSAFKRRWDWVYMPIGYKNNNWAIEIGEKKYNWVDFQHKINESIYAIDNSEDKQLGDYFVNADRTDFKISADTLLNKILFYIWNDVCKDDPDQIFRWKDDDQEKSIKFSDFFGADRDKKLQGFMSFHKVSVIGETTNADNSEDIQDEVTDTDESPSEDDNDVNA